MQPRVVPVHGNGNKVRAELLTSQLDAGEIALEGREVELLVTYDSGTHHGISAYLSQHEVRAPVQRIFDGAG
ncbi:hypothetical protein [Streptomyces tubercidicus]|uniref:hypothetical protein n=1 Tax=Streptomyces tubercidicus TaxID=47759 RepID=UPI0034656DEC